MGGASYGASPSVAVRVGHGVKAMAYGTIEELRAALQKSAVTIERLTGAIELLVELQDVLGDSRTAQSLRETSQELSAEAERIRRM